MMLRITLVSLLMTAAVGPLASASAADEPKVNQPTRPGLSRSAEIQRAGVLQVEAGADARPSGTDSDDEQSIALTFRYAAIDTLVLEAEIEPLIAELTGTQGARTVGVGDTVVGTQWVAANEGRRRPATAVAYYAKLPTAPHSKALGTGRLDHRLVLLLSKKFGETDADLNVAYLNVGDDAAGRRSGAMIAASVGRELPSHVGFVAELSHATQDVGLPKGVYALGAATYRFSERTRVDAGIRLGLTADAPRFGVVGGISMSAPMKTRRP